MKKNVLITGVSGGIGQAIACKLVNEGYVVYGTYFKDSDSANKLSEKLGDNFHPIMGDLSSFDKCNKIANELNENNINIDILINNAGISIVSLLQDLTDTEWNNIWNTNVTSAVGMSKAFIPVLLKNGRGHIINISSVWGNRGASMEVAYSATKGAINSFTKALAKELGPSNIQVNALSCGIIDTKMNAHLSEEDKNEIEEEIPMCRIGTPEDVAEAVTGLLNSGSYITGQIITIDGGWQI